MNVRQAIAQLGIEQTDGLDLCIVRPTGTAWEHYTLAQCGSKKVAGDLYLASGLYHPNTLSLTGGRVEANVARILWLPFDFDLSDYLGCSKESLYALGDAELWRYIEAMQRDVEETFVLLGLPLHRLDYTGYGLAAFVKVPKHEPAMVPEIRRLHKAIVARINKIWRGTFADPQVSDAGTRIMRLVPCENTKGGARRQTRTIFLRDAVVTELQLRAAAGDAGAPGGTVPPERIVPKEGKGLDEATLTTLIEALRPCWGAGNRHSLALGLGGMLAKAGVPETQATAIVEAMDDDEPGDRVKAIHTSYERVRSGLEARGFYALRELLPGTVVEWLDRQLQAVAARSGPTLIVGSKRTPSTAEAAREARMEAGYTAPPDACYFGWFSSYRDLMAPTSEAADAFHLGAGLTLAAALIGRRVFSRYASDPLYANLYTVLIGRTGTSRKDTAIKRITRMPQLCPPSNVVDPGFVVERDVSSAEGLIGTLQAQSNTLLYLTELSGLLKNAKRKGTTTILDRLIEAWDTPDRLQNLSKGNPLIADKPYLSIIAATQPARIATEVTPEDIASGFANRWLYIVGSGKPPMADPAELDDVVAGQLYMELWRAIRRYPEGHRLDVTPAFRERWTAWYMASTANQGRNEDEDDMRSRHATLIRKLALIYAVSESAEAIDVRHLEPAIALIDWMWGHVRELMKEWGTGVDLKIEARIRAALLRHGVMHRRDLQQRTASRHWSGREFAAVFRSLAENGLIEVDPTGNVEWAGE